MRVLITNSRLDLRGGAEMFVRDLARGLQRRGHSVLAYTSDPGQGERLLENDGIPVCTDPGNITFRPDIIHAQHHLDAMTAILSLPGIPAVYHCHGAVWKEMQPKHPRIVHYLAMSRTLRERMCMESNLPADSVEVLLNGVNLERFSTVRTPPARLATALFYNSHHRPESPTVAAIVEACSRSGITLDFAGRRIQGRIDCPERELPRHDLVFASGRSAIDALACGCAVVVLGRNSCGPLVASHNFATLREANFAIAANAACAPASVIMREISRYDAADCAAVAARLREEADMDRVVDRLEVVYREGISAWKESQASAEDEMAAVAAYLRRLVPVVKMLDETHLLNKTPLVALEALLSSRAHLEHAQTELAKLL